MELKSKDSIIEEPTSTLVVYPGSSVVVSDGEDTSSVFDNKGKLIGIVYVSLSCSIL